MWAKFIEEWESTRNKKKNSCKYCHNDDMCPARDCVFEDGTERFLMVYDDGTFLGKPFIHEREINFCPMCGRKVNPVKIAYIDEMEK